MIRYFLFLFLISELNRQAFAYIDPGTTSIIFSSLTYLLMILSVFLGVLIWPFRRFYKWLSLRFSSGRKWLAFLLSTVVVLAVMSIVACVFIFVLF